jgi:hypothetical protein
MSNSRLVLRCSQLRPLSHIDDFRILIQLTDLELRSRDAGGHIRGNRTNEQRLWEFAKSCKRPLFLRSVCPIKPWIFGPRHQRRKALRVRDYLPREADAYQRSQMTFCAVQRQRILLVPKREKPTKPLITNRFAWNTNNVPYRALQSIENSEAVVCGSDLFRSIRYRACPRGLEAWSIAYRHV